MKLKFTSVCSLFIALFAFPFIGKAQVSVTASAGIIGPTAYTTLKASFDAINSGTHQGNITITISANTTEPATASLNASGNGSASYTSVIIKPGAGTNPTISGSINNGPLVKLNGANNVTVDGSNNGSSSRNLGITNTSTTGSNAMIIGSVGNSAIHNDIIKNCNITNGTNASTAVIIGDAGTVGGPGYFNNITMQNNAVMKAFIGIYVYAVVATNNGNNTIITGNDMTSSAGNAIRLVGIYVQGADGVTVSNNQLGNFEAASAEFDRAIWFATATKNSAITGNSISNLAYTGTSSYAPIGLNISCGITNANITVSGNTVSGLTTSGTGNTMGIFSYSAMADVFISSNNIYNIKNTNTSGYGAAGIVLVATINNAATKVYNNFISDVAGYGFNGYDISDNGNGIVIDGGGGYDINFNTVAMTQSNLPALTGGHRSSAMLITANVTSTGSVNLRNNIFANLQTTGNANSRIVLSNLAGSGVFSAINRNDYYATSTNLSSTGTNASITNTIAQLQTSLGGNGSSVNILPVFAGVNDLHIPYPSNIPLNNLGTPIAGITTDIDGETRNATTPDIGADEIQCMPVNITLQPVPSIKCSGDTVMLVVNANNGTTYQWQQNTGSGFSNMSNSTIYNGVTNDTLYIYNVPATLNGSNYQCIISYAPGCSSVTSSAVALTINPGIIPTFTIPTPICNGSLAPVLPTTSNNGITGTWNPATVNNTATGTYTFTPTAGQCATTTTLTVTVNSIITPTFNVVSAICNGGAAPALPATSTNGITGTWNPATVDNTTTATYTFTPTAGQCAATATLTVNVNNNTLPVFTAIAPICNGSTVPILPATSTNGITGTWNPATVDNTSTATYTFTPTAGQCAVSTTLTVTVNPNITPTFTTIAPICNGAVAPALPATSNNGITGTWTPSTVSNTATATYTFTPTAGLCATPTTLTVTVNPNITPTFTVITSICNGATAPVLPTTSNNGITGIWSPATVSNTATGTYTFTPTPGLCASTTTLTITVNPIITPTFTAIAPICSGATAPVLPTTSNNGITGTWNPATISNATTTTYTFTPTPGLCATTTTLTVTVNPNIVPAFTAVAPICNGTPAPLLSTTSNNGIPGTWNPAIVSNTATATYTFTPAAGLCATTASMTITVKNVPAITVMQTICATEVPYTWNGIPNATTGTVYTTTAANGCDSIVTLQLTVLPPAVTVVFDTAACGSMIYKNVAYTHSTTLRDTFTNTFGCDSFILVSNLVIYPNTPQRKSLDTLGCNLVVFEGNTYASGTKLIDTFRNILGCDSVIRTVNIIIDNFELNLSVNPKEPYKGEMIDLVAYSDDNTFSVLSWSPAELFPVQQKVSYSIAANADGIIIVEGINEHGCTDTASVTYHVKPLDYGVFIPNAFTPNGDGNNEKFGPRFYMERAYAIKTLKIFNRYGQTVYSASNTPNGAWDGNLMNGSPADVGNYKYYMIVKFVDGTEKEFKGDLTLLR
ncbi:T9SS type B sorting domain-containing protein [Taibaiella lutea]|uniref:T9SS type B sorting domain-containing protein n=1 Tax=Taibaiella lutea TaxID=2608001 RepID=A0A5M6CF99_9BACT|nr:gliding motility-associated C-terminal domain-containing protein [Taibaiella lutea]KAA5533811.1 T9SS type B sorting domain-containing protein [Taibaiella lutea]